MQSQHSLQAPLQSVLLAKGGPRLRELMLILGGVLLLAFASQLTIPLRPVPITFQSATVILVGMAYGARLGTITLLAYLAIGALGLPVFAEANAGMTPFFGETAGYLIGFVPAAAVSGYLAQNGWGSTILTSFAAACVGTLIIFAFGLSVLSTFIGWQQAMLYGLMPFIITEPVKLLAASAVIPRLWKKS